MCPSCLQSPNQLNQQGYIMPIMCAISKPTQPTRLHHTASAIPAFSLMNFNLAMHGFGSGYFHSTCLARGMPFCIHVAANPTYQGQNVFKSFCKAPVMVDSAMNLLKQIQTGTISNIHGHYIESPLILSGTKSRCVTE
jgi:hypothetical protein